MERRIEDTVVSQQETIVEVTKDNRKIAASPVVMPLFAGAGRYARIPLRECQLILADGKRVPGNPHH